MQEDLLQCYAEGQKQEIQLGGVIGKTLAL